MSDGRGYRLVRVTTSPGVSRCVLFHRLKFLLARRWMPPLVDHRDRDTSNNSVRNLRASTRQQNAFNSKSYKRADPSLPRGVLRVLRKCGVRYAAAITLGGRKKYLGTYDTHEEASAMVEEAVLAAHGEFYREVAA